MHFLLLATLCLLAGHVALAQRGWGNQQQYQQGGRGQQPGMNAGMDGPQGYQQQWGQPAYGGNGYGYGGNQQQWGPQGGMGGMGGRPGMGGRWPSDNSRSNEYGDD